MISELGQPPELADDPSPKSAAGVVPVWSLESVAAGNAVLGKSLRAEPTKPRTCRQFVGASHIDADYGMSYAHAAIRGFPG